MSRAKGVLSKVEMLKLPLVGLGQMLIKGWGASASSVATDVSCKPGLPE